MEPMKKQEEAICNRPQGAAVEFIYLGLRRGLGFGGLGGLHGGSGLRRLRLNGNGIKIFMCFSPPMPLYDRLSGYVRNKK